MRQRMIRTAALVAAWVPFLLAWFVFMKMYDPRMTVAESLPRAVYSIGGAAVLGIAVSRFCAKTPWPDQLRAVFYARHLIAAMLYAAIWIASMFLFDKLIYGTEILPALRMARALPWQFLMGVWLYGVIAGVSYAIQTQRQAMENERRALRAEAGLTAARLDALRSRLHPHFLFNALHTVGALVREDPAQAENAIEKLGDILRYTLKESSADTVPFAEEWEFTRRYLEFEQLRYGARLHVATTIDPACMTCSAPSFALQTLVENAVRHSIATRPAGGRIEITAHTADDSLHVRVRDDGGNGVASTHNGSHYGLAALRERLSTIYGGKAGLAIASNAEGFEVSFTVPRQNPHADDD